MSIPYTLVSWVMRLGNDMLWALIVMISRTFWPIGPRLIGHGPDLSYILAYWTELIDPRPQRRRWAVTLIDGPGVLWSRLAHMPSKP